VIDLDLTLEDMLEGIAWHPEAAYPKLSDIADERVRTAPQSHLSFDWYPTEPDIILRLFCLYLKTFSRTSFDAIYNDLGRPVKHATGNSVKRGNDGDLEKPLRFDHYFTEKGVVVAISDQGEGFDYRSVCSRFQNNEQYFTYGGKGFKWFAKCDSKISYTNGGSTLLIQFEIGDLLPESSHECFASAGDGPIPFDIIDAIPNASLTGLYKMARCGPDLLYGVWKNLEFLDKYLFSALPGQSDDDKGALIATAEIVDVNNRGTMVRYRTKDDEIVAKFFRKGDEGAQTYEILHTAWSNHLGSDQPYRVPRPLAYHADRRLLVIVENEGTTLEAYLSGSDDELIHACQRAARWLRKFHAVPTDVLSAAGVQPEDKKEKKEKKKHKKKKLQLDQEENFADLSNDLFSEYQHWADAKKRQSDPIVPIHGRFAPETVLLNNGITAAIDFDSTKLGECGADLSRFVLEVWEHIFRTTGDWHRAEMATEAFLDEYAAGNREALRGLPYHWGTRILRSFEYHVEHPRHRGLTDSRDKAVAFFEAQLRFAGRYAAHTGALEMVTGGTN
jgi:aminoglycoside phosphotransferase (APT) family kinase protein